MDDKPYAFRLTFPTCPHQNGPEATPEVIFNEESHYGIVSAIPWSGSDTSTDFYWQARLIKPAVSVPGDTFLILADTIVRGSNDDAP